MDTSTTTRLTEPETQRWQLDWAPDGTRVAFLANSRRLTIVDVGTSQRQRIDLPDSVSAAEARWHPSGDEIFLRDASDAVHALTLESGGVREVLPPVDRLPTIQAEALSFSADGSMLALALQDEIRVLDLRTGRLTTWRPGGAFVASALSPDAASLVAVFDDRVLVATIEGTLLHDVRIAADQALHVSNVDVSPDSRYVLLVPRGISKGWLVDVESGTAEEIDWGFEGGGLARWRPGEAR
jgi:hypothetical protein